MSLTDDFSQAAKKAANPFIRFASGSLLAVTLVGSVTLTQDLVERGASDFIEASVTRGQFITNVCRSGSLSGVRAQAVLDPKGASSTYDLGIKALAVSAGLTVAGGILALRKKQRED